jgi:uncharacterized protein (DUF3820 family)
MKDSDLMPWGKYQGKQMIDVPADYLLWLYENNKCSGSVKSYIIENLDVIKEEIKRNQS